MIKAVAFDFGGVLSAGGQPENLVKDIATVFQIPEDKLEFVDLHDRLRRGRMSADEFVREMAHRHGVDIPENPEGIWSGTQFLERSELVYELARTLRENDIATAIFSNVYEPSAVRLRELGHYDGFDPVVLSFEAKMAKPDIEFFELLLEKLNVQPDEIIFVDDQDRNQAPAVRLGIHFVKAVSPNQIVDDVTALVKQENDIDLLISLKTKKTR